MMRRTCLILSLVACGGSPDTTANTAKPSCDAIKTTCAAYTDENANEGHACYKLGSDGTEASCSQAVTKCQRFCQVNDGAAVVANYGALVYASYDASLSAAVTMQETINAFIAAPSPTTMTAARDAWKAARTPYLQTEAYRFYSGPIDSATTNLEGRINAWPMDEQYIDYIIDAPTAGIINGNEPITVELLAQVNAQGETNISTGWHAIEFLLWGQDTSAIGPGDRPYTDYLVGGTATNQGRRREYLQRVTELLITDLTTVRDAWAPNVTTNYRAEMGREDVRAALAKIVSGIGSLMNAELYTERMEVAYNTRSQEDEHSCFSDNTLNDFRENLRGVENVYLGRFGSLDGEGIEDLVIARDAGLDAQVKAHIAASYSALDAIPGFFDQAILGDDTHPGRVAVKTTIDAMAQLGADLDEVLKLLGLKLVPFE